MHSEILLITARRADYLLLRGSKKYLHLSFCYHLVGYADFGSQQGDAHGCAEHVEGGVQRVAHAGQAMDMELLDFPNVAQLRWQALLKGGVARQCGCRLRHMLDDAGLTQVVVLYKNVSGSNGQSRCCRYLLILPEREHIHHHDGLSLGNELLDVFALK